MCKCSSAPYDSMADGQAAHRHRLDGLLDEQRRIWSVNVVQVYGVDAQVFQRLLARLPAYIWGVRPSPNP